MVAGADIMLDVLALQMKTIKLQVVQAPIDDFYKLRIIEHTPDAGGATYTPSGRHDFPHQIWLCDVTKYVFGGYMPLEIYFQRIS